MFYLCIEQNLKSGVMGVSINLFHCAEWMSKVTLVAEFSVVLGRFPVEIRQATDYPYWRFSWFSLLLPENAGIMCQIRPQLLDSNSVLIQNSIIKTSVLSCMCSQCFAPIFCMIKRYLPRVLFCNDRIQAHHLFVELHKNPVDCK